MVLQNVPQKLKPSRWAVLGDDNSQNPASDTRSRRRPEGHRRTFRAEGLQMSSSVYTVYMVVARRDPAKHYTGITRLMVDERLACHNAGKVAHTAKFGPWRIET